MSHETMAQNGTFATILSGGSALISIITIGNVQSAVSVLAGLVAIVSGCFAIRYYYKATNKIK